MELQEQNYWRGIELGSKKQWDSMRKYKHHVNLNNCPFCCKNPCECSDEDKKEIFELEMSRWPLGKQLRIDTF